MVMVVKVVVMMVVMMMMMMTLVIALAVVMLGDPRSRLTDSGGLRTDLQGWAVVVGGTF
mgnify:CR=1 FL=1